MIKCLLVLIAAIAFVLLPPFLIDGVEFEPWVKTALGAYLSVLIIIGWTWKSIEESDNENNI